MAFTALLSAGQVASYSALANPQGGVAELAALLPKSIEFADGTALAVAEAAPDRGDATPEFRWREERLAFARRPAIQLAPRGDAMMASAVSQVRLEGEPEGTSLLLTPVPKGDEGRLATRGFWDGPFGPRARELVAGARPGAVIDIVNRVFDDQAPWPLVPEPPCPKNADCIPPEETIFHLVAPEPGWPVKDLSIRSAGEITADFPATGKGGARQRVFIITKGPTRSVVEGFFTRERAMRGFILEFNVADPARFESIAIRNIDRAIHYMTRHWGI